MFVQSIPCIYKLFKTSDIKMSINKWLLALGRQGGDERKPYISNEIIQSRNRVFLFPWTTSENNTNLATQEIRSELFMTFSQL